ncbi:SPW repeat domain-containing protein [Mesonia aquimarina]|uniref:SPW repeat domain-containing protein n=1 Tax=Mesonia aquimarina TaxID=1504967 RepID=UPI000EF62237|nr:hypothetical protein [Mesonia aquimarina]
MWAQIINTILGLWLMIAPAVLNYDNDLANNSYIVGPLIITFSVIAYWEATRVVRKWNYPLAIWLLAYFLFFDYSSEIGLINNITVGVLVFVFSTVKGKVEGTYGGGWGSLWKKDPIHYKEEN